VRAGRPVSWGTVGRTTPGVSTVSDQVVARFDDVSLTGCRVGQLYAG
jgi:hypothetical protein